MCQQVEDFLPVLWIRIQRILIRIQDFGPIEAPRVMQLLSTLKDKIKNNFRENQISLSKKLKCHLTKFFVSWVSELWIYILNLAPFASIYMGGSVFGTFTDPDPQSSWIPTYPDSQHCFLLACYAFYLALHYNTHPAYVSNRTMSPIIAEVYTVNTMNWRLPESVQADLRQLGHPYYIVNILLCLSFLVAKLTHPLCDYLFAPGPVSHSSPFF